MNSYFHGLIWPWVLEADTFPLVEAGAWSTVQLAGDSGNLLELLNNAAEWSSTIADSWADAAVIRDFGNSPKQWGRTILRLRHVQFVCLGGFQDEAEGIHPPKARPSPPRMAILSPLTILSQKWSLSAWGPSRSLAPSIAHGGSLDTPMAYRLENTECDHGTTSNIHFISEKTWNGSGDIHRFNLFQPGTQVNIIHISTTCCTTDKTGHTALGVTLPCISCIVVRKIDFCAAQSDNRYGGPSEMIKQMDPWLTGWSSPDSSWLAFP